MNDAVNHPAHYATHPSGIECIEISKFLSGCLAQAFQYVWRAGQKDDYEQELNKAIRFIKEELTLPYLAVHIVDRKYIFKNLALVIEHENDLKGKALEYIATANSWADTKKRQRYINQAEQAVLELIEEYKNDRN